MTPLGGVAAAGPPDEAEGVRSLPVDVLVLVGATRVEPDADTPADAQLYNVAGLALTNPLGQPLTWGAWSTATATSRVSRIGGPWGPRTDVRMSMEGLVRNGVYSVFWATLGPDSFQPLCPTLERLVPLDALKPHAAAPEPTSFVADATGTAEFHGRVNGDLLAAESLFFTVVFHADGQTYYPFPNRGEFETHDEDCRASYGTTPCGTSASFRPCRWGASPIRPGREGKQRRESDWVTQWAAQRGMPVRWDLRRTTGARWARTGLPAEVAEPACDRKETECSCT